jgi:hypothetical protein
MEGKRVYQALELWVIDEKELRCYVRGIFVRACTVLFATEMLYRTATIGHAGVAQDAIIPHPSD